MGNLEKLLVVGVLVIVIAILAVSFFWTNDVATLPEVSTDSIGLSTLQQTPPEDNRLPGEALSAVGANPNSPSLMPNSPALNTELPANGNPTDAQFGDTPLLMSANANETAQAKPLLPGEENYKSYTIKKGDTLEVIAKRELGSKSKVSEILKANEGLNPRKLVPGKTILIPRDSAGTASPMGGSTETEKHSEAKPLSSTFEPTPSSGSQSGASDSYVVVKGDTLWKVAKKTYGDGNKWKKIFDANRNQLPNADALRPGMKLKIPN